MTNELNKLIMKQSRLCFNPIQDGGIKKVLPTSFSPVTSTNVGMSPKNFLPFSFNPFPHWWKILSLYQVSIPNY